VDSDERNTVINCYKTEENKVSEELSSCQCCYNRQKTGNPGALPACCFYKRDRAGTQAALVNESDCTSLIAQESCPATATYL
jgi:hypothetical protein